MYFNIVGRWWDITYTLVLEALAALTKEMIKPPSFDDSSGDTEEYELLSLVQGRYQGHGLYSLSSSCSDQQSYSI